MKYIKRTIIIPFSRIHSRSSSSTQMSTTPSEPTTGRIGTRSSNASKHPGAPDKPLKRRSPVEMAASRAAEKALQEKRDNAERNAPLIIAGIEDLMAEADNSDNANAARPIPADIPRVVRTLRRSYEPANAATLIRHEEIEDEDNFDGG